MRTKMRVPAAGLAALFLVSAGAAGSLAAGGSGKYEKVSGVSGSLNFIGSDTLLNLMTLWGEGFLKFYPSARVQGEGKGSSTAPPALIEGTAQLGPMSREMKSSELDAFEKKFGYPPTQFRVALDALAVYVNKDNPIKGLSLPQIDAIFSKNRKGGLPDNITTWGEAGLSAWADKPISLYGRNSASGTYGYFKEIALFKGDYKDAVKEQPGSASVVQGVEKDLYGIGYSGMGYATSGVRKVPLAQTEGGEYYTAELENVMNGKYPLSRFLYIYVNQPPGKPLDPLVREFLSYVLSQEGQEQVTKDGFIALPEAIVAQEREKLSE
jgi:phosphate transport system substrate-binding protein